MVSGKVLNSRGQWWGLLRFAILLSLLKNYTHTPPPKKDCSKDFKRKIILLSHAICILVDSKFTCPNAHIKMLENTR